MKIFHLQRVTDTPEGTFGLLLDEQKYPICVTLERPWKDNKTGESCIPKGEYVAFKSVYNTGGYKTFELKDVPGRTEILIHKGNTYTDTKGCILIGSGFGMVNGVHAITASGEAHKTFMNILFGENEFKLVIA